MDISFLAEQETPFLHLPPSTATTMDSILEDYNNYWETNNLFQVEDIDHSWGIDDLLNPYYDTSSSDGAALSPAETSKNIVSERNRRKKLNDRLLALRVVVPNITKMDKASIIKDAIKYIEELHEEEKKIEEEIRELENGRMSRSSSSDSFHDPLPHPLFFSSEKNSQILDSHEDKSFPIEVLELSVTSIGEKIVVVKMRCRERRKTMLNICKVFESLKLKEITSNISSFSNTILKTVFIEAEKEEIERLKIEIEAAIASHNHPQTP